MIIELSKELLLRAEQALFAQATQFEDKHWPTYSASDCQAWTDAMTLKHARIEAELAEKAARQKRRVARAKSCS